MTKHQQSQQSGGPPTQAQAQALSQAYSACEQAAQAHGVQAGAVPWNVILPLVFQLIQELLKGGGGQQQPTP